MRYRVSQFLRRTGTMHTGLLPQGSGEIYAGWLYKEVSEHRLPYNAALKHQIFPEFQKHAGCSHKSGRHRSGLHDLVICSSLLHEVPSAPALLASIHEILNGHSLLNLNVPNSESFHRRLAKSMGLIADTKVMTDYLTTNLIARKNRNGLSFSINNNGAFVEAMGVVIHITT